MLSKFNKTGGNKVEPWAGSLEGTLVEWRPDYDMKLMHRVVWVSVRKEDGSFGSARVAKEDEVEPFIERMSALVDEADALGGYRRLEDHGIRAELHGTFHRRNWKDGQGQWRSSDELSIESCEFHLPSASPKP